MSINVIQYDVGYDIYDRFTMEHFLLRQNMISTTSFFSRDSKSINDRSLIDCCKMKSN
jgi:hypothetical protein